MLRAGGHVISPVIHNLAHKKVCRKSARLPSPSVSSSYLHLEVINPGHNLGLSCSQLRDISVHISSNPDDSVLFTIRRMLAPLGCQEEVGRMSRMTEKVIAKRIRILLRIFFCGERERLRAPAVAPEVYSSNICNPSREQKQWSTSEEKPSGTHGSV